MSTKKEIIEDVFGKGVSLNTIKNQFGSYLKGSNRLLKDVDQAVDKIFETENMEKFSNRIKTYKKYMDRELKESKSKKLGDGLKDGKKTDFGMLSVKKGIDKNPKPTQADRIAGATMKDGSRTKVRGTGAAKKGFRKAKLS